VASAAAAAAAHDRHAALVGRSLWRIEHAARETLLEGVPPFLTEEEASYLPRSKRYLFAPAARASPLGALPHRRRRSPHIVLEEGDTAIFSSRVIPGNERAIAGWRTPW